MRSRRERKLDRVLRRVRKRATRDVTKAGTVRGFHGGCPAAEPPFLGTYALAPDGEGGMWCTACGTTDLLPYQAAMDEARRAGLIDEEDV